MRFSPATRHWYRFSRLVCSSLSSSSRAARAALCLSCFLRKAVSCFFASLRRFAIVTSAPAWTLSPCCSSSAFFALRRFSSSAWLSFQRARPASTSFAAFSISVAACFEIDARLVSKAASLSRMPPSPPTNSFAGLAARSTPNSSASASRSTRGVVMGSGSAASSRESRSSRRGFCDASKTR